MIISKHVKGTLKCDSTVLWLHHHGPFPRVRVHHLVIVRSDHLPIFLDVEREARTRQPHFIARYEIMWECENSLADEILSAWSASKQVNHLGDIAGNLRESSHPCRN
jgi:hypothetical protein